jgi:hypothetical protein
MNGRGSSFLAVLVLLSLQTLSHAQTQFTAKLSGSQTVPPVSTTASGTGVFELTDEGLRFNIVIDGDALTGPITVAHFHNAAFGDAGNVVNTIGDDFDGNAASGVWSRTDPIEPLTPEFIDELFAGNIYVNIHTQANPAGEIRGQLVPSGRVAELDGEQTVPSVSTTANGIGYFELSAAGLSFKVTVAEDLLSGPITAAHFHNAPPGQAGGVVGTHKK